MRALTGVSKAQSLHICRISAIRVCRPSLTQIKPPSNHHFLAYSTNTTSTRRSAGARMTTTSGATAAGAAAGADAFPTLVSAEWLKQHLGDVKLLDATWYLVMYTLRHRACSGCKQRCMQWLQAKMRHVVARYAGNPLTRFCPCYFTTASSTG